jgi:hypothetical protein
MTSISYDSIFKIGQCEERYLDEMFSKSFIEHTIVPIAAQQNRYFSDTILYPEHLRYKYDIAEDPYNEVIDYQSLHQYIKYFVEAKYDPFVYGIRNHTGPLSTETYLIQQDLLKFFDKGYITQDSEPGLVYNSYYDRSGYSILRPYVFLMGDKTKMDRIHQAISEHPMLTAIDYDAIYQMDSIFNHFTEISLEEEQTMRNTYTFGFFGTRLPNQADCEKDNYKSYFEYILSNQFFSDLLEIA